jgi:hypothetical protein
MTDALFSRLLSATGRYSALLALLPSAGFAAGVPTDRPLQLETLIVSDDAGLAGEPRTASEGVVLTQQLEQRPTSRPAELLEFVPGLIATQHSGEGKANQYFLRGFNLDHGTDFAVIVDGLPVNLRSHGHGQGYTDLNFLIPELVETLSYRKGPLYAEVGDFATAGSADFRYRQRLPSPLLEATVGEFGYYRALAAGSQEAGGGTLLAAGAVTQYEGPWQVDQDLRKLNGLLKYSRGGERSGWSLTGMAYDGEWTATNQVPQRAVEAGTIDRFGAVDPTDGGETHRYSLSLDWRRAVQEADWQVLAYAMDYRLELYTNPTYFLDDPINGDQVEQFDQRQVYGLETSYALPLTLAGVDSRIKTGLQLRYDDIGKVALYRTRQRERLTTVREDSVDEFSAAMYGELSQRWHPRLRSVAGLRLDYFHFDVQAQRPENSGRADDAIVSPKLNLIFGPWAETEYFLGAGRGFHSNDARGVTVRVDPVTGEPAQPVDPLVSAWSAEAGLRSAVIPNTQLAFSVFALELDSELIFVADAATTEASGKSRRYGFELGAFYAPLDWLIVDADLAWTHARFVDAGDEDRIPNAVERVASLGLTVDGLGPWSGALRLRHLGEAPLVEDNSVRSESTTVVNGQIGYQISRRLALTLAGFNLFDSADNDITYFYASRLPGEPAEGVEDVHFHPVEPRNFRLTLRAQL